VLLIYCCCCFFTSFTSNMAFKHTTQGFHFILFLSFMSLFRLLLPFTRFPCSGIPPAALQTQSTVTKPRWQLGSGKVLHELEAGDLGEKGVTWSPELVAHTTLSSRVLNFKL